MAKQVITVKQKKFADEYIEIGNATEAYKRAYYTKNMSKDTINTEAKRTLRKPPVKDYIDQRMKKIEDAKIPKQKEILEFYGRVMRGEETTAVMTDQGVVDVHQK